MTIKWSLIIYDFIIIMYKYNRRQIGISNYRDCYSHGIFLSNMSNYKFSDNSGMYLNTIKILICDTIDIISDVLIDDNDGLKKK